MANSNSKNGEKLVLVTGGTGFVGVHCILQLLRAGYRVRTTLRSFKRKDEVLEMLKNGGVESAADLSFVEADLTNDTNWDKAVENCDHVLHVASPITLAITKDENEFIKPAVEGTLRVLRAAREAGVKRVVLTSSFGAIGYGHPPGHKPFTEEDWTDLSDKGLSAYLKSKTLAEKAAWDFIANEGGELELTVINPVGIFGPQLGADLSTGLEIIKNLMDGDMRAVPQINFGIIDVRDVADLHIRAMTNPAARGQRFLALAGEILSLHDIAMILRNNLGDDAKNVTTRVLPNWFVRVAALFNARAGQVIHQLGKVKHASNQKAKTLLGWEPRSNEEAIVAAAKSLLRFGLIKKSS